MKFTPWEPTLADAAFNGAAVGLVCFFALVGLMWAARFVIDLFEADLTDDEEDDV